MGNKLYGYFIYGENILKYEINKVCNIFSFIVEVYYKIILFINVNKLVLLNVSDICYLIYIVYIRRYIWVKEEKYLVVKERIYSLRKSYIIENN